MITEISVMYGSEKVNNNARRLYGMRGFFLICNYHQTMSFYLHSLQLSVYFASASIVPHIRFINMFFLIFYQSFKRFYDISLVENTLQPGHFIKYDIGISA